MDRPVLLALSWPFLLHLGQTTIASLTALVLMTAANSLAIPLGLVHSPRLTLNLPIIESLGVRGSDSLTSFPTLLWKLGNRDALNGHIHHLHRECDRVPNEHAELRQFVEK